MGILTSPAFITAPIALFFSLSPFLMTHAYMHLKTGHSQELLDCIRQLEQKLETALEAKSGDEIFTSVCVK